MLLRIIYVKKASCYAKMQKRLYEKFVKNNHLFTLVGNYYTENIL